MRTTLEIIAEAKQLLRRAPVTISAVEKISPPVESDLNSWARNALGFDPFNRIRMDIEQRNDSAQQQNFVEALLASVLRRAEIEPYDPATVKQYMDRMEQETDQRPIQLFLKALCPDVQISEPLFFANTGLKAYLCTAGNHLWIPIDGSRDIVPSLHAQSRNRSVLPEGLAPVLYYTRLLAHPETAALRWYACEISDYQDEIPDYVLRKVKQLNETFQRCNNNANLKLSFQVIFSAASESDFRWGFSRWDYSAPDIGRALVCRSVINQSISIRATALSIRLGDNPVLCRDFSLSPLDAVNDAKRFEQAVYVRRLNGTPIEAFGQLSLYERLTADCSAIPLALPRCEPFMVATVSSPTHTAREVIEVWDERSFAG